MRVYKASLIVVVCFVFLNFSLVASTKFLPSLRKDVGCSAVGSVVLLLMFCL